MSTEHRGASYRLRCPTPLRLPARNLRPGHTFALRRFFKVGHSGKFWEIATRSPLASYSVGKEWSLQRTEALRVCARKRAARGSKNRHRTLRTPKLFLNLPDFSFRRAARQSAQARSARP